MKYFYPALFMLALFEFGQNSPPTYKLSAERNSTKSEKKFVAKCLCQPNIDKLFGKNSSFKHEMGFDTMRVVQAEIFIKDKIKAANSCTGIYYYKLYFPFGKTGRFRGAEFYRCFCIVDKQLFTFSRDTIANRRIYTNIELKLIQSVGREKIQTEQKYLMRGGAYFD